MKQKERRRRRKKWKEKRLTIDAISPKFLVDRDDTEPIL